MASLYFYYSTMSAGKTSLLLQSAYNYSERNLTPLLLTPAADRRDGVGTIKSRIGLSSPATVLGSKINPLDIVRSALSEGPVHCVLVDEAQFLSKAQVQGLTEIVDLLGIPVLAYGLRSDFRGEPFEGSQYLLTWADHLKEVKTICPTGRKATMNLRVTEDGQPVTDGAQVEVGGNDRYVTLCRAEFNRRLREARADK